MHLVRSGSGAADIAALDPDLIGYVQICDAPLKPRYESYMEEAMYERLAPGAGELGLADIVAALPRDRVFSLEVPLRSQADAGVGPHDRLRPCVEATRRLLAQASS
jgi:sugar phosphate isomerase/epimerase